MFYLFCLLFENVYCWWGEETCTLAVLPDHQAVWGLHGNPELACAQPRPRGGDEQCLSCECPPCGSSRARLHMLTTVPTMGHWTREGQLGPHYAHLQAANPHYYGAPLWAQRQGIPPIPHTTKLAP